MILTWAQWRQLQAAMKAPILRSANPAKERQEEQREPNKAKRKQEDQGAAKKEPKAQKQ